MSLFLHLVPVTEVNEGKVTKVRATTKETGIQMKLLKRWIITGLLYFHPSIHHLDNNSPGNDKQGTNFEGPRIFPQKIYF